MEVTQSMLISTLRELSQLEKGFKSSSFANAASAIISLDKDRFDEWYASRKFTALPGIGKSTAAIIVELEETGQCERLEKLRADHQGLPSIEDIFL